MPTCFLMRRKGVDLDGQGGREELGRVRGEKKNHTPRIYVCKKFISIKKKSMCVIMVENLICCYIWALWNDCI